MHGFGGDWLYSVKKGGLVIILIYLQEKIPLKQSCSATAFSGCVVWSCFNPAVTVSETDPGLTLAPGDREPSSEMLGR